MDVRLTIIITKPCQTCDEALFLYQKAKLLLEPCPELKFTGSITQVLDPCCGKGTKNVGKTEKT